MTALEFDRMIHAPIETVFAALTDPDVMSQWFFHEAGGWAEIRMDAVVGGTYSIAMHGPSGNELKATGEFREVLRPSRLVFSWNTYATKNAIVTIELAKMGEATHLMLRHELPPEVHTPHRRAWEAVLDNLRELLG